MFTPKQVQEIGIALAKRFKQRMGMETTRESKLLSRRDGLTVTEGMCPHCRKAMTRMPNEGKTIRWKCEGCKCLFRVVDPRDEINQMTGGE